MRRDRCRCLAVLGGLVPNCARARARRTSYSSSDPAELDALRHVGPMNSVFFRSKPQAMYCASCSSVRRRSAAGSWMHGDRVHIGHEVVGWEPRRARPVLDRAEVGPRSDRRWAECRQHHFLRAAFFMFSIVFLRSVRFSHFILNCAVLAQLSTQFVALPYFSKYKHIW